VRVKKGALDHFRKRAREAFPLEFHAYLLGSIKSIDTIEIVEFCYPKVYQVQTTGEIQWSIEEYAALKEKADREGLTIVADIHSHPKWDAVMSSNDYKGCIIDGLSLCAIVSVYGKKTRVRFWNSTSPLPASIVHYT
jgi:proteasome lid subunit RPN8/RPN11